MAQVSTLNMEKEMFPVTEPQVKRLRHLGRTGSVQSAVGEGAISIHLYIEIWRNCNFTT